VAAPRFFVDDAAIEFKGKPRFHLMAATVPELHAFCATAGINRCWFHNTKGAPHYDITAEQREAAIALGAMPVRFREIRRRALAANTPLAVNAQAELLLGGEGGE